MTHYESPYVKCPYYHRNNGNMICCEGVDETTTLNLTFTSKKRINEYVNTYCNCDYKQCRVHKMLDEKWSDKS